MINVAVVEDNPLDQKKLKDYFARLEKEEGTKTNLHFFAQGNAFLLDFEYGKFDLVLMDIELEGSENGIVTSRQMRNIDNDVTLVFMTNLAQYAIDGYKVKAVDYVVKPIAYFDFATRMRPLIERIEGNKVRKISIASNEGKIVLTVKDIYYVEVSNHVVIYHTNKGDYKTYKALKRIVEELSPFGFSLCNSCYLVNLNYVESVEGFVVSVKGTPLQISRPKKKGFLKDLSGYLGE